MAEGVKIVEAAFLAGADVDAVFVASEGIGNPAVERLADEAIRRASRVFELAPGVMGKVADTVTPQPVCAVVKSAAVPLADLAAAETGPRLPRLLVVCVDVRDPGNLGAVMRSASASGSAGLVLCAGCVDAYNPKTVRASAGAVFSLRIARAGAAAQVLPELRAAGWRIVGTSASGGVDYVEAGFEGDVALLLGNEASGLPEELLPLVDETITIPMAAGTESLNVAMTASVLCFEAARRRRSASA